MKEKKKRKEKNRKERQGKKQDKPTTACSEEVRERTFSHYYGIKMSELLWIMVGQLLQESNMHVPYDTAIPPLNLYPREMKSRAPT